MNRLRWYPDVTIFVTALVVAASLGYRARDLGRDSLTTLQASEVPPLDSFVDTQSFSEIQNTRAELQGLAQRFRTEARMKHLASLPKPSSGSPTPVERASIVRDLERGIEEFKDTPEEVFLVQDLLLQLRAGGQFNRWLDVYLDILYRRPTEEAVGTLSGTAQWIAQATGREAEVTAGFQHILEIPLDFAAKQLLQESAARRGPADPPLRFASIPVL
jgi:hypothetical protein